MPMKMRPGRAANRKAPAEPGLDQPQIVRAALGLLDEAGFDGLTMRRLAEKLGVKAASLYWHVRGKQELLGLLADEICAPLREPDRTLPWRDQLEALAHEYRRVLHAHRDAARVLASSGGPAGPHTLRLSEIVLRTLLEAGLGPREAAYAGLLLNDYVTMFVLEETQAAPAEADGAEAGTAPAADNWPAGLPAAEYPSVVALASYLTAADADERFQFGIETLRGGLEIRLAQQHGR